MNLINIKFRLILLCLSVALPLISLASPSFIIQSEGMNLNVERVATGLNVPWGLAFISKEQLLVTERGGYVRLLNLQKGSRVTLKNLPRIMVDGQGGMLDVAIPPNYKKSGWIYFTYVKEVDGEGSTVLARAKIKQERLLAKFTQWQDLLVTQSTTDTGYHFGSRIAFDGNGHVFFSIGDRGVRPNGQDRTNHAGTILRLNLDGSVPADNPFINTKGVLPEIWSYGHRNPQGLSYDVVTKQLWSIEHGPRGGDEINLILRGRNYGWPII